MNWIERMYEIKGKDLYSQNSEGLILEYIFHSLNKDGFLIGRTMFDIGSGDRFILSNSRHLMINDIVDVLYFDKIDGFGVGLTNCDALGPEHPAIISIDIDGNDYWILDKQLPYYKPEIVVAEFNPAFTDSRTIVYNPDHVWAGDNYYGFSFEAGKKLAEKHGYRVIFQLADMNMFMIRADMIEGLSFPEVKYNTNDFFKESGRLDWIFV